MNDVIIVPYAPEHRARWDQFVQRSKNGTFLFERSFMEYHGDRFADASALAIDRADRLLALFPASRSGAQLSSHAGLSYGGMISNETMTSPLALEIFAAWFSHFRKHGIAEIFYRAVPSIYHRMPADEDRYALFYYGASLYSRDVTQTIDFAARAPVQDRRRRGAKKAQKAGLIVRETDAVEAFWEILAENLK